MTSFLCLTYSNHIKDVVAFTTDIVILSLPSQIVLIELDNSTIELETIIRISFYKIL